MKKTLEYLIDKKRKHTPITMLTAYDFPTAVLEDEAGIDSILVGDSVGTNILGYKSEREVTLSDMIHHLKAVSRGVKSSFLIADLPFGTTDTLGKALKSSEELIASGADCVKIEGWEEKKPIIRSLTDKGISVCAHIGYNPQIHEGKPRTFGKTAPQAVHLIKSSVALEQAGASLIVLEKMPSEIAKIISETIHIPTIGIGSGPFCDGQVLVIGDLIGMTPKVFKHVKAYAKFRDEYLKCFGNYISEVEQRVFPAPENSTYIENSELEGIKALLKSENF